MKAHPVDEFICPPRLAAAWCAGCGIGTVLAAFLAAVIDSAIERDRLRIASGLGCTERAAGCLDLPTRHAGRQYLLDHAADLSLAEPAARVVAFMNNADLLVSGAQDLQRAVGRGARLVVIHFNNIIYAVTRHGLVANTPFTRPSWDRRFELPFNVPDMAVAYGARYVARWTQLHAGWLTSSIGAALAREGVSVIEVIAPCLLYNGATGGIAEAHDRIQLYDRNTAFGAAGAGCRTFDIRRASSIVVGELFDQELV